MRTKEENRIYQKEYYHKNKANLRERRHAIKDVINQKHRNNYWKKKTGSTANNAFLKYIRKLLWEDKLLNH